VDQLGNGLHQVGAGERTAEDARDVVPQAMPFEILLDCRGGVVAHYYQRPAGLLASQQQLICSTRRRCESGSVDLTSDCDPLHGFEGRRRLSGGVPKHARVIGRTGNRLWQIDATARNARQPIGSDLRRELGKTLRTARRDAGLTQQAVAASLGWSKNRLSLIETGRVRVEPSDAGSLADTYRLPRSARAGLLDLADRAAGTSPADALSWVTSHNFRKTTATILDQAGQTARQVADQLGHSRPSMTQDIYLGRSARNPDAAKALDGILPYVLDEQKHGVNHGQEARSS